MSDFLLELGLEEVPAKKILRVIEDLKLNIEKELKEYAIPFEKIDTYGTSRRIAVIIKNIAESGRDLVLENKGPSLQGAYKDGKPTKALLGFCQGQNISLDKVVVKELKGLEYVYAVKKILGVKTKKALPDILKKTLENLYFSKAMYWGDGKFPFIRPIRTIVSLWNEETIDFNYANVKSGRKTKGHRFLSQGYISISKVKNYTTELEKAFIIVDISKRKKIIEDGINCLVREIGVKAVIDPELLEEVNFLVEYPTVFLGDFEESYLKLPREVIITIMVNNQKYFPVVSKEGLLLNYFIGVRCGNKDSIENVVNGNKKVLKARLEDGVFFYNEDLKTQLLDLRHKMNKVIYQEKLGTLGDKIERVKILSRYLSQELSYGGEDLDAAVSLIKTDLGTRMVYEFPELQGIMGYYYALKEGYKKEIALSIKEHYQPITSGDEVPQNDLSIILALSDKVDTLTSIVKAGLIPKGSQDLYGLRRIALGIIRILIENKKYLEIDKFLEKSRNNLNNLDDLGLDFYLDFLKARFRSYLKKEGLRYDLIDSILTLEFKDIYTLYLKALTLKKFSHNENFDDLVILLKRISNIVKDNKSKIYDKAIFLEEVEDNLERAYKEVKVVFDREYEKENYYGSLKALSKIKEPLDEFFNLVMVMVDDEKIRNNRIALLRAIKSLGERIFIASKIVN